VASASLEDHIGFLLARLPKRVEYERFGVTKRDVFCFWESASGHGGPAFSVEMLRALADAGFSLDIDFYSV